MLRGRRGLEVTRAHGDREVRGSNQFLGLWEILVLSSRELSSRKSLFSAKMDRTLKSTWATDVGKTPALKAKRNSSDIKNADLKWNWELEKLPKN